MRQRARECEKQSKRNGQRNLVRKGDEMDKIKKKIQRVKYRQIKDIMRDRAKEKEMDKKMGRKGEIIRQK